MSLPVLLGLCDPHCTDPERALWPNPPGSDGWRIWMMMRAHRALTPDDYANGFERRNIVSGRAWSIEAARSSVSTLRQEFRGRSVVVFGAATWCRMGLTSNRWKLLRYWDDGGIRWWSLPNPNPRNYNDLNFKSRAGELLVRLWKNGRNSHVSSW